MSYIFELLLAVLSCQLRAVVVLLIVAAIVIVSGLMMAYSTAGARLRRGFAVSSLVSLGLVA